MMKAQSPRPFSSSKPASVARSERPQQVCQRESVSSSAVFRVFIAFRFCENRGAARVSLVENRLVFVAAV